MSKKDKSNINRQLDASIKYIEFLLTKNNVSVDRDKNIDAALSNMRHMISHSRP